MTIVVVVLVAEFSKRKTLIVEDDSVGAPMQISALKVVLAERESRPLEARASRRTRFRCTRSNTVAWRFI